MVDIQRNQTKPDKNVLVFSIFPCIPVPLVIRPHVPIILLSYHSIIRIILLIQLFYYSYYSIIRTVLLITLFYYSYYSIIRIILLIVLFYYSYNFQFL